LRKWKLLGYKEGSLVPFQFSDSKHFDDCARQMLPSEESSAASCSLQQLCLHLRTILEKAERNTIPLSNVKRLLKSQYSLQVSQTTFGFTRFRELLEEHPKLQEFCTVSREDNGYHVTLRSGLSLQKLSLAAFLDLPPMACPDEVSKADNNKPPSVGGSTCADDDDESDEPCGTLDIEMLRATPDDWRSSTPAHSPSPHEPLSIPTLGRIKFCENDPLDFDDLLLNRTPAKVEDYVSTPLAGTPQRAGCATAPARTRRGRLSGGFCMNGEDTPCPVSPMVLWPPTPMDYEGDSVGFCMDDEPLDVPTHYDSSPQTPATLWPLTPASPQWSLLSGHWSSSLGRMPEVSEVDTFLSMSLPPGILQSAGRQMHLRLADCL